MATLYTQQRSNIAKTWVYMTGFFLLLIGIGFFVSQYYGNANILYIFAGFSIFMNVISYWYSDKIVLSMYRAVPVAKADNPELYTIVENLAITAGLPMPRVYIVPDTAPNAFATGRDKNHASIAVTSGLLSILNKNELEGVVAHEMAHVGNRDILIATVVVVLVGLVSIIANIFTNSLFFGGGRNRNREGSSPIFMIIGIVFIVLSPIVAMLIQFAISRKREYLADASGALLTRYPEGLASALEKISKYSQPLQRVNAATAHLFISNPLGGSGKKIAGLFATHPPAEDRIRILRNMSV